MAVDETTPWTVTVAKDTDIAVRTFLAQRGMHWGDMSTFVEEAVKWRMFDLTLAEVRQSFSDLPPDDLQATIDEATRSVRDEMRLTSRC